VFLLPSLAFGLVFALLLGGNLARLLEVRFRLEWTVPLALAVQVVLFSRLANPLDAGARGVLHMATYALLLGFTVANLRLRTLAPVLAGVVLNGLAIATNAGRMPVSAAAAKAAGIAVGAHSSVSENADRLWFLGDVFALPARLPLANVFSLGDILIGFGMIAFIVVVTTSDAEGSPLDIGRLALPFRTAAYRRLATGKLVSHLGDWLTLAALIGWVYETTKSTASVAALLLARLAPPILGAGIASVVVDRFRRQGLVVYVEVARGAAVAAALVGVVTHSIPLVLCALAVSGALAAISAAAVSALVPSLLPAEQLASANAGLGIAKDLAMALGAVGAGAALSFVGPTPALVVDLVSFVLAFVLFRGIRVEREAAGRRRKDGSLGGLRYLLRRRRLLLLVLSFASATLATGLANATFPGFFNLQLGLGAGGYGFALAALAGGLALGEALVGFARTGEAAGRWIGAGLLMMAGFFVLLGTGTHLPTALLVIAAIGFVDGTTDVLFETFIQHEADPAYYGAVFGLASAFMTTTMIGAIAAAPLLNRLVSPAAVIVSGSGFLMVAGVIALIGMTGPSRAKLRRPGTDVSVVTWEPLLEAAESAAAVVAPELSVEIVALPFHELPNLSAVVRSVEKTSKLIVFHQNGPDEAFAADVAARIGELAFEHLDVPIRRVAAAREDLASAVRSIAR
jgi:hypothetical protein